MLPVHDFIDSQFSLRIQRRERLRSRILKDLDLRCKIEMRRSLADLIPKYLPGMEREIDFYRTFRRFNFVITHIKGRHVLDIGTGHGLLLDLLNSRYSITGVDIHSKRNDVIRMDTLHLGFKEDIFDTVIMAEVVEHLENPLKGLQEAHRVIRPGGRLILTTRNLWAAVYLKRAYRQKRLRAYLRNLVSEFWNEAEQDGGWHLRFRPDYLLELIREANFEIFQFKALDYALGRPLLWFTRLLDEYFRSHSFGNCIGVVGIKRDCVTCTRQETRQQEC